MGWLLFARNQSKLHRTTITRLWNSSSLHDNDERENTKELFYVYSFTQSLFLYDIKKILQRASETCFDCVTYLSSKTNLESVPLDFFIPISVYV